MRNLACSYREKPQFLEKNQKNYQTWQFSEYKDFDAMRKKSFQFVFFTFVSVSIETLVEETKHVGTNKKECDNQRQSRTEEVLGILGLQSL